MLKQGCGSGSALLWEAGSGSGSGSGSSKFRSFKGSKWSHGGPRTHNGSSKWSGRRFALKCKVGSGSALKWKKGSGSALQWWESPKNWSIFDPQNCYQALETGSGKIEDLPGSRIWIFFHPGPGSGSKGQKSSISRISNTGWKACSPGYIIFVP